MWASCSCKVITVISSLTILHGLLTVTITSDDFLIDTSPVFPSRYCDAETMCPAVMEQETVKERSCDTLWMCIITTLNQGLRNGGGIGDVLRPPSSNEPFYTLRLIYDMLFFFVVIIIVLNLIFGVIIDTFADLRTEKNNKEEIIKNTCFICGLERKVVLHTVIFVMKLIIVCCRHSTTKTSHLRSTSGQSTICGTICTS